MGGTSILDRQQTRVAVASIVVLCVIAAMLVPAARYRAASDDVTDNHPIMTVLGQTEDAMAGRSIAFVDINGDGIGDLVVGAPGDTTGGMSSGKVMIYLGDDVLEADPDVEIIGSAGERFGYSVALAGDVNSDGTDDLIVGAPGNDTGGLDAGVAYIIFGVEDTADLPEQACDADVVTVGLVAGGQLGYSVSAAGDVNLDSYDDVIVGAPSVGAGTVHMLYGGSSMSGVPVKNFTGTASGDQFGFSVAGGMNLDGSAQPDIAIGAPGRGSNNGEVSVVLSPDKAAPKIVTLTPGADGGRFGASLALLDFNGDVYGDLAVGAPNANGVGSVLMYFGSSMAGKFDGVSDVEFSEGQSGDMFGSSIAAGEPRTDNIGDLLVGAPMNDTAGVDAGRAYVFYGNASADVDPDVIVEGEEAGAVFGLCVASGGASSADYDDNGSADFAVGAPRMGDQKEGAAYLYPGFLVIVPANPTVYGYVLDAVTGDGLSNALVTFESAAYSDSVRTTANGSYGISTVLSVPPGAYWINASFDEYFTGVEQQEFAIDTQTNVSFDLDKLPIVHGTIYDGNATGWLEDALVEARDDSDALLDSMTTDTSGDYSFMLDALGAVTITVSKEDYIDGTIELVLECNADIEEDLTLNHYPMVEFSAEDTGGDPIEGVDVTVSIGGEALATGETDASGGAFIVVPGTGTAYVNSTRVGYVSNWTVVVLTANTVEPVAVVLETQPSISGTVREALFETPISGAVIDLFVSGSTDVMDTDTSDSHGYYVFDMVEEGTYDLRVTADGYMRDYRPAVVVVADKVTVEDFWLYYDDIPPTSEISDPQPGLISTEAEIPVFANATDPNDNEIAYVELWYSYDGKPYKLWDAEETGGPYAFVFNSSEADGDGMYEFYTIAYDCASNAEPTPEANDTWVIISSGAPESEVAALDEYQTGETFTVNASGTASIGVAYIELWYSYDGGAFENYGQDDTDPYSWEFTAADGDGEYAFYSICVNTVGLEETVPDAPDTSTLLDTTDPGISMTSPEDGAELSNGTVALEAAVTDGGSGLDHVTYQVDTEDAVTVELEAGQTSCDVAASLELADGEHTIFVEAADLAGNAATDSVSFVIDTVAPSVEITSPNDGVSVVATEMTVEWTVDDGSGTGVDTIEVRLDGGTWTAVTGDSHEFTDLDLGEHTVDVRATDNVGNSATDSVSFTLLLADTTPPELSITSPANNSHTSSSTVTVAWSVTDGDGTGIATVEVKRDSGEWADVTVTSVTYEALTDGTHTVSVRATDNSDNVATASVTFMVDTTDPSLSITSPDDDWETEDTSVTVTWTCTDGGCGIDRIEVRIDDGSYVSVGTSLERAYTDLAVGEHTVDVRAYDEVGNMAEDSVTFTVTEKGGGISGYVYLGIALVIVVVVVAAVLLMRKKKSEPPPIVLE